MINSCERHCVRQSIKKSGFFVTCDWFYSANIGTVFDLSEGALANNFNKFCWIAAELVFRLDWFKLNSMNCSDLNILLLLACNNKIENNIASYKMVWMIFGSFFVKKRQYKISFYLQKGGE